MLRFIFRGRIRESASSLIAFTDTLPINRNREAVVKAIKESCRTELGSIPFKILHHRRESNVWIQVADYCTWSVFRKWQNGDLRTYEQIRARLQAPELDCLRRGTTRYY